MCVRYSRKKIPTLAFIVGLCAEIEEIESIVKFDVT